MDSSIPEKRKRSGSETRQATERVTLRLTPEQRRQLDEWADSAGVARASYILAKLFTGEPIRAVRSPSVDRKALAQFLAWLGRLNGNVYQISRAANFRQWFEAEALTKALKEITELRNAVLVALGHEPV
jgi:uncharacterized protein (DUF1778 family)